MKKKEKKKRPMSKKVIGGILIFLGVTALIGYPEDGGLSYILISLLFVALGIYMIKKNHVKKPKAEKSKVVKKAEPSSNQASTKQDAAVKKSFCNFKVAGVTKRNDQGDNIQYLIGKYVKEILEFEDPYQGLKNKEIYEDYYDDKVYEAGDIYPPHPMKFVFDPFNQYDPNAIKIFVDTVGHIGYVPASDNVKIGEIIRNHEYDITWEITGGKYKYVDEVEDKIKTDSEPYGIEVTLKYQPNTIKKDIDVLDVETHTDAVIEETPDVTNLDFVAIDFETANSNNNSACSMGLALVKNSQIIDKQYYLIRPPILDFSPTNIGIHGITPKMVKNSPKFPEVWQKVKHHFDDNIIVAHNASFDISVLKSLDNEYGLGINDFNYMCSINVSNKACDSGIRKSLEARAHHLGVGMINHHNALDDAVTCANIVIESVKRCNHESFSSFLNRDRSLIINSYSELKHQSHFGSRASTALYNTIEKVDIKSLKPTVENIRTDHPFYNKCFVFTGKLDDFERADAMQRVINLGGIIKTGVSSKVDFLVVGWQDKRLVGEDGLSSAEEKAYALIEKGKEITILTEDQFKEMLKL